MSEACSQKKRAEIILLLRLGAGTDGTVDEAIRHATAGKNPDWETIETLLKLYSTPANCVHFGRALLLALRHKKFSLARSLFQVVKSITENDR